MYKRDGPAGMHPDFMCTAIFTNGIIATTGGAGWPEL